MATTTTRQYQIRGFHCSGCADNLDKSLARLEGVIKADADYVQAVVQVRFDPERVGDEDVHAQIRASGYEPVGADEPS
jgi:copper chaperone CopZ